MGLGLGLGLGLGWGWGQRSVRKRGGDVEIQVGSRCSGLSNLLVPRSTARWPRNAPSGWRLGVCRPGGSTHMKVMYCIGIVSHLDSF